MFTNSSLTPSSNTNRITSSNGSSSLTSPNRNSDLASNTTDSHNLSFQTISNPSSGTIAQQPYAFIENFNFNRNIAKENLNTSNNRYLIFLAVILGYHVYFKKKTCHILKFKIRQVFFYCGTI